MKCRRKKFSQFRAPTEYYWDKYQQRVVAVGWAKAGSARKTRRQSAYAIERALRQKKAVDNYVDKLIQVERDTEGRATRHGDKFRIHDDVPAGGDEQEA